MVRTVRQENFMHFAETFWRRGTRCRHSEAVRAGQSSVLGWAVKLVRPTDFHVDEASKGNCAEAHDLVECSLLFRVPR